MNFAREVEQAKRKKYDSIRKKTEKKLKYSKIRKDNIRRHLENKFEKKIKTLEKNPSKLQKKILSIMTKKEEVDDYKIIFLDCGPNIFGSCVVHSETMSVLIELWDSEKDNYIKRISRILGYQINLYYSKMEYDYNIYLTWR